MDRLFPIAAMLMMLVAVSFSAGDAMAAPVSLSWEEFEKLGLDKATVSQSSSRPAPEPKREAPRPPAEVVVATAAATAGSSMSGSSFSLTSGSGGAAASDLPHVVDVALSLAGSYLRTSDWLDIPLRFLDGIFRPPRHIVSL